MPEISFSQMPHHDPASLPGRIETRLAAIGLSSREASLRATGSDSTIRMILSGRTENPRRDTLEKLAGVLGCSVEWLATGADPAHLPSEVRPANGVSVPSPGHLPKDVPVLGTVAGSELGKGAFQLTPEIVDYVRRPTGLAGAADAFALFVEGESMAPRFEPGDLVFVHPHRKPRNGDYVVIEEPDSNNGGPRGFIKRLIAITQTHIRTQQFNPPAEIAFVVRPGLRVMKVILDGELYGL